MPIHELFREKLPALFKVSIPLGWNPMKKGKCLHTKTDAFKTGLSPQLNLEGEVSTEPGTLSIVSSRPAGPAIHTGSVRPACSLTGAFPEDRRNDLREMGDSDPSIDLMPQPYFLMAACVPLRNRQESAFRQNANHRTEIFIGQWISGAVQVSRYRSWLILSG